MTNGRNVLKRAVATYGIQKQSMMLFEEMSELQKEVCKFLRGKENRKYIIEETADVLIMIEQLKIMHHIKDDELKEMIDYKVKRLEERLDNEE